MKLLFFVIPELCLIKFTSQLQCQRVLIVKTRDIYSKHSVQMARNVVIFLNGRVTLIAYIYKQ